MALSLPLMLRPLILAIGLFVALSSVPETAEAQFRGAVRERTRRQRPARQAAKRRLLRMRGKQFRRRMMMRPKPSMFRMRRMQQGRTLARRINTLRPGRLRGRKLDGLAGQSKSNEAAKSNAPTRATKATSQGRSAQREQSAEALEEFGPEVGDSPREKREQRGR